MAGSEQHISGRFDDALRVLRDDTMAMGSLALANFESAARGLLERDSRLCNRVIAEDEEVDSYEIRNDRTGFDIILRFQPLARDLRQVISALKISSNLERIGDAAVGIARRVRKLNEHPSLPETQQAGPLYHLAWQMLRDTLRAYADSDFQSASETLPRDRELDRMCKDFEKRVCERIPGHPDAVRGYLNLIHISRAIERIGDHSKNICEDVIYITEAMDVRHGRNPGI